MISLLSSFARPVPYYPKLRRLAGSVTAAVLVVQLDYWFEKKPNGFFKFMEPCGHPAYKDGDSWTEELDFSKKEFATAFSKIGIAYKSMTAYKAAKNPFVSPDGRIAFYCSYQNKRTGQTFYLRNHQVLNNAIASLFSVSTQSDSTVGDRSDSTVGDRSGNGQGDRSDFIEVTDLDAANTEITNRDYTETTNTPNPSKEGNRPIAASKIKSQNSEKSHSAKSGQLEGTDDEPENKKSGGRSKKSNKRKSKTARLSKRTQEAYVNLVEPERFDRFWVEYRKVCDRYGAKPGDRPMAAESWTDVLSQGYLVDDVARGFQIWVAQLCNAVQRGNSPGIPHACNFLAGSTKHLSPYWLEALQSIEPVQSEEESEFTPLPMAQAAIASRQADLELEARRAEMMAALSE